MYNRKRIKLEVLVDLDNFPGAFHTPESAQEAVQAILLQSIGHYDPIVFNTEE